VSRWSRFAAALALLTIARSAVFVFMPASHFDSDQAVTGLMAKHLAGLRAFPVFWYGQTYMLAVEAWLAAPVMAIAGATVTALKLPLLAMNVAIVWLLFRGLTHDAALEEARAAFATLFFALAAPITSAHLLTANGGNVEPCLYVLLLWTLRRRALWMGIVLGIGFLNREFTVYGFVALAAVDALNARLFTRERLSVYGAALATAATVWLAFFALRQISSPAGPGTTMADLHAGLAGNNLVQVAARLCVDAAAIASGAVRIVTVHWPELFGLESQPLTDFGIESSVRQGFTGSAWLLLPILGIPLVRGALRRVRRDAPAAEVPSGQFPAYLMVVAAISIGGYLAGRCGIVDFYTMRYELLSVLGAAGLSGWYLRAERSRPIAGVWAACCGAVFAIAIGGHARLMAEYLRHPPVALKQQLIGALEARGVRYASADYWTAYYVSFMTRERIVVAADEIPRIREYQDIVNAHRAEAIRIARKPCEGGEQLTAAFWACKP